MQAVGLSACAHCYRDTTSAQLLNQLTAALADKSLPATLNQYASWNLLLVDEFGFDRIERDDCPQAAHLLYKAIARRHQTRSTIVITNIDFNAWGEYLGDAPLAMAMLDRLVDGALVLKIKGRRIAPSDQRPPRPKHFSTVTPSIAQPPHWTNGRRRNGPISNRR
jgi:DNA replication protein DnaC